MKILPLLLMLTLILGCSSRPEGSNRDSTARDSIIDSSASLEPSVDRSPMKTTSTVYQLRRHPAGVATDIIYTYTNSSGSPVYLVNCNGDVSPSIQRERNGIWENAWGPGTNACLSPPVVIAAGATFRDTFEMVVAHQEGKFYNEIASPDSARRYRLIWHQALSSFDMNARPFGPDLPIEQRVSNPFELNAPTAGDSNTVGTTSPTEPVDGAPMRTSARVYQLRSDQSGLATEIAYTYTNSSGAPLHLTNCNGDVSPGLQRERGGTWEDIWWPIMNECLSPPVVIPAGGTYRDKLLLWIDREVHADLITAESTTRYRLIWHQARTSSEGNAGPSGRQVPVQQRVSNAFVLRWP